MLTYKLWLEQDKDIPRFKRLHFKEVEVPIIKLMKEGIHPYGALKEETYGDPSHIVEKILSIINNNEFFPKELAQFEYCHEIERCSYNYFYESESKLDANLNYIKENIYFVGDIPYLELIKIAKERIKKIWSHRVAKSLAQAVYPYFGDLRAFLKQKDNSVKLSGYRDVDKYRLDRILSPGAFFDRENVLVSKALPIVNFRACSIIEDMTTPEGYLSLIDEITDFRISLLGEECGKWKCSDQLVYNCTRKGDVIHLIPDLEDDEKKRALAKSISSRWGENGGKYCFSMALEKLNEMNEVLQPKIGFPLLNYTEKPIEATSSVKLKEKKLVVFSIGKFVNKDSTNGQIISILRHYKMKVTGKKEELIERLANLIVETYEKEEGKLDAFFSSNRFIRVPDASYSDDTVFEVRGDTPLKNMLLTMYALKHLRGNTILERSHVNNSFEHIEGARALLNKDVTLSGIFLRIEEVKRNAN